MENIENIRYPVGKHTPEKKPTAETRAACIRDIADLPARLRAAVEGLSASQLDTPYREGGWTIRQVVHHLADSHMNAFVRIKLALTEQQPTIKAYDQGAWAETVDARGADVGFSLAILDGLHARLAALLGAMAPADFARTFRHPERGVMSLDDTLQMYAWHSRHHLAHVTGLRERRGWR